MNAADPIDEDLRRFQPLARGWRRRAWSGGSFDTAFRPATAAVEGRIRLHHPTIFAILEGGCESIEVASECGHTYRGADFAGAVSFVPRACGREIRMRGVRSRWASLSIRPDFFWSGGGDAPLAREPDTFTNVRDPFLHAMLAEMERLVAGDGALDQLYGDAMAASAACYLMHRYGHAGPSPPAGGALPCWRLRRVTEYIDANLANRGLCLDDLADCAGLSTGFFHRAFRQATGETPWARVQRLRLERAMQLLGSHELSVLEIAGRVGFLSPSHLSRLFRRHFGLTPSQYRRGRGC